MCYCNQEIAKFIVTSFIETNIYTLLTASKIVYCMTSYMVTDTNINWHIWTEKFVTEAQFSIIS